MDRQGFKRDFEIMAEKNPAYHVITFEIKIDVLEPLQGILYQQGALGLEELPSDKKDYVIIKAYFDAKEPLSQFLDSFPVRAIHELPLHATTITLQSIKQNIVPFEPLELIPGTWIVPPKDMNQSHLEIPDVHSIIIRPGMAFGTGRHETTQLVAEIFVGALLAAPYFVQSRAQQAAPLRKQIQSVLDVGCGSGILALFAAQNGISKVDGVEIDPQALNNARENIALNNQNHIQLYQNLKEVPDCYDCLLANILASTLIYLKEELLSKINKGGFLIASGITVEEAQSFEPYFARLTLIKKVQKKEWLCYCFQNND
ncbi:MAG: hypothetical protein A2048_01855 [Deltaproteobacteria bacterium GWA2_45_12]|nr:MAG: hypothetical protein A2048_01855 [Deltaproteobacteria bacterium GWA2_45_12]